jgi:hypothetical protein
MMFKLRLLINEQERGGDHMLIRKRLRAGISLMIALLFLIFSVLPVLPARAQVTPQESPSSVFAGGTGTETDPYLVATAEHLNQVRNHLAAHFRQTADIDLGTAPWNKDKGWRPIGASTSGSPFTGTFDGGGFTISGLTINRPATGYQGLFGYTTAPCCKISAWPGCSCRQAVTAAAWPVLPAAVLWKTSRFPPG